MKKWTKKEVEYLQDNPSQSGSEIAKVLDRTKDSINNKRKSLGIIIEKPVNIESVREDVVKLVKKEQESNNAKKVKILAQELLRAEKERDAVLGVSKFETYSIVGSVSSGKKSEATTISLFSDLHGDERVKKSQVNGVNEYNKEIAKKSTEDFFIVVAQLIKVHQREYDIKNHILALLGDFISGSIHDDLKESQDIQPTEAIWMVGGWILSGIKYLRKECPEVNLVIPCSMGNHSRITEKQRIQTEYGNSLELLLYNRLAEYFENDKNVTFLIGDSYLTYVNVYGKELAFHHGHSVRYAGGVGGITIPMNKAVAQWDKMRKADYYFSGHLHSFCVGSNFIVNGSVIGYNPYAISIKAGFERPTQTFCLINRERELEVIRKIILR
ncbi:MAG: metallophosphoesterase [Candidatus Falkowbacteria bacterium]